MISVSLVSGLSDNCGHFKVDCSPTSFLINLPKPLISSFCWWLKGFFDVRKFVKLSVSENFYSKSKDYFHLVGQWLTCPSGKSGVTGLKSVGAHPVSGMVKSH